MQRCKGMNGLVNGMMSFWLRRLSGITLLACKGFFTSVFYSFLIGPLNDGKSFQHSTADILHGSSQFFKNHSIQPSKKFLEVVEINLTSISVHLLITLYLSSCFSYLGNWFSDYSKYYLTEGPKFSSFLRPYSFACSYVASHISLAIIFEPIFSLSLGLIAIIEFTLLETMWTYFCQVYLSTMAGNPCHPRGDQRSVTNIQLFPFF